MTGRYQTMFSELAAAQQGAFVPFTVIGDPCLQQSERIIDCLVGNGADALELGIPFSDPVADGPVIQAAANRGLAAGARVAACFDLIERIRARFQDLPIGLLVYANLVHANGVENFYSKAAKAGVDSVLVADLPVNEAAAVCDAARANSIAPVLIAAHNTPGERLRHIAEQGGGYTYTVTRAGVTGSAAPAGLQDNARTLLDALHRLGAPPPLVGFGISTPAQVTKALELGAAGVISGSAIVRHIADNLDDPEAQLAALGDFVQRLKQATRAGGEDSREKTA